VIAPSDSPLLASQRERMRQQPRWWTLGTVSPVPPNEKAFTPALALAAGSRPGYGAGLVTVLAMANPREIDPAV